MMTGRNKRSIVIAVVGFFAVMLMLTVLSRTVASFAVVEVETVTASRNTISETIKASAAVQTRQEVAMRTEVEQTVETLYVSGGDAVASGDALFKVREDDLEEGIVKLEEDRRLKQQRIGLLSKQIEDANAAAAAAADASAAAAAAAAAAGPPSSGQAPSASAGSGAAELDYQRSSEMLERDRLDRQLAELYALRDAGGVVCSPVAGTVTEVLARVGDMTSQSAVLLIADASAGTKLVFSVGSADAENVTADAAFSVTKGGTEEPVQGVELAGVAQSPLSSEMTDVTLLVPADAAAIGATLDVEIAVSSLTHDTCVPLSALHQSTEGAYVFVVEEQQTALGAEQVARTVNVTVAGRDGNWAAVDGIGREQLVIVKSTKMLTDTDRVLAAR